MSLQTRVARVNGIPVNRIATEDHYDLSYDRLLAAAEPSNWPRIMPGAFTAMIPLGLDARGWDRYIEHTRYGPWRLRTPLKFWKSMDSDSYRVEYALDKGYVDPRRVDPWVTVDQGYIWVRRSGTGVLVCTLKDLAITGTSAWFGSMITPWLGWQGISREFFHSQARLTDPHPFVVSKARSER